MLKSKFIQGSANAKVVDQVWGELKALFGFVLSTWSKRGRRSTSLDQITDAHLTRTAGRVNRSRREQAIASGQPKYTSVNPLDALKAIYRGDQEYNYSEVDAAGFVDKLLKQANINTPLSLDQRIALHDRVFEAYASTPEAQDFITLEDLTDDDVKSFDPPKPDPTASANGKNAPAPATV